MFLVECKRCEIFWRPCCAEIKGSRFFSYDVEGATYKWYRFKHNCGKDEFGYDTRSSLWVPFSRMQEMPLKKIEERPDPTRYNYHRKYAIWLNDCSHIDATGLHKAL